MQGSGCSVYAIGHEGLGFIVQGLLSLMNHTQVWRGRAFTGRATEGE